MRTQEEYKAEVLRRAEQCRKERKKNRRRIVMACMCMLLVCGAGYISLPRSDVYDLYSYQTEWPELYDWLTPPDEPVDPNIGTGGMLSSMGDILPPASNTYGEQTITIIGVQISEVYDGSEPIVLTQRNEIKKLCNFLQTAINMCPADGELIDEKSYEIRFLAETEEKYSLLLLGNRLIGHGQNDPVFLSEKMLEKFKRLIGE